MNPELSKTVFLLLFTQKNTSVSHLQSIFGENGYSVMESYSDYLNRTGIYNILFQLNIADYNSDNYESYRKETSNHTSSLYNQLKKKTLLSPSTEKQNVAYFHALDLKNSKRSIETDLDAFFSRLIEESLGNSPYHLIVICNQKRNVLLKQIFFNPNSLQLVRDGMIDYDIATINKILTFKNALIRQGLDTEHFLMDSGTAMAIYGLRKANDFDYLCLDGEIEESGLKDADCHNEFLWCYGKTLEEVISSPDNFAYVLGMKVVGLEMLLQFRKTRNWTSDREDVRLIENRKRHVGKFKDTVDRAYVSLKRSARPQIAKAKQKAKKIPAVRWAAEHRDFNPIGYTKHIGRKILDKGYGKYTQYIIDNLIGDKKEMSVRDILYMQCNDNELMRIDTIIRYLAVLDYYGVQKRKISGFELYRKLQDTRIKDGYSEKAVNQFRELIKSYDENGYDKDSYILLDKNLQLIDGSHRLALGLYHGISTVNVIIQNISYKRRDFSIDWFYQNGFTYEEVSLLKDEARRILDDNVIKLTGIIWSPAFKHKDDIIRDLRLLGDVTDVREHHFKKEQYNNICRKLYEIDEIAQWKIEKKLSYMEPYDGSMVSFKISVGDPKFRIKDMNNLPISVKLERIKQDIRERYRPYVKNYFRDIILHIADNEWQSLFMNEILNPHIDVGGVLEILNKYQYALVKTDVPYFPEDFPETIPVGKDLDILCLKRDFIRLVSEIQGYIHSNYAEYDMMCLKLRNGDGNIQIRLERCGYMVFQFDISYELPTIRETFVQDSINNRLSSEKGFYTIDNKHEYIVRLLECASHKEKKHHINYCRRNIRNYDENMLDLYLDDVEMKQVMKDIIFDIREKENQEVAA